MNASRPDALRPEALGPAVRYAELPGRLHAYGFPRWKQPIVRQCFPGRHVVFVPRGTPLPPCLAVLLWGMDNVPGGVPEGIPVLRLEDGFLRSAGLGADIVRPLSWVVDARGIYYDATQPSELEEVLATRDFSAAELERARALREAIVTAGLTKYNVGARVWQRPPAAREVILVPGQVESDAALRYGAPTLRGNLALLQAVRAAHPQAYVIYKPHPDVVAGMRLPGSDEHQAGAWSDEVVTAVSMAELLCAVDAVHVLTSLAGFEALLRGKPVTCHGQPFYAGWGLTDDRAPHPRRTRALTLDALVAGVLIAYPLYLSRDGRRLLTPEQALAELKAWRTATGGREPWWRGIYRVFVRRIAGVR